MTKLNPVNIGMNKWCGPAVLSILTGKSTDECARVIQAVNGQYDIEGVYLSHLLKAADKLGFDSAPVDHASSLYGTLVRLAVNDGMYVVVIEDHFVVLEVSEKKIYLCDNHTKNPMPAASSARLLQKVMAVRKVFKRREPILLSSKYVGCKSFTPSGVLIEIYQRLTYDMPGYDKSTTIARLSFKSEEEVDEFFDSMKEGY